MAKILANAPQEGRGQQLIANSRKDSPFYLCFSRKLENGYTFESMLPRQLKELDGFIDKYAGKPIELVDKNCFRKPDHHDKVDGNDVSHYKVGYKFRIHGYYLRSIFHVCRIDPNHKMHK